MNLKTPIEQLREAYEQYDYYTMKIKAAFNKAYMNKNLPVVIEKDENGKPLMSCTYTDIDFSK